jgi:hypothetical protein
MQSPKRTAPARDALRATAKLAIEPQPAPIVDQQAVAEGRKPPELRRKDFAAILANALELYGIPATGCGPVPRIETAFRFSPADFDAELNPLQVESLLEQAVALIDRCAGARSAHERWSRDKWEFQLEFDRFLRLARLQDRQRQAGVDTIPYERAVLERAAEAGLEANHRNAEAQLKALMEDLAASGLNKLMAAREVSAWLAAYPLKDSDLRGDDAIYSFDGARKSKPEHLFEAARAEADEAAWAQFADLMARRFAGMAASDSGRFRKQKSEIDIKWSLADMAFQRERLQCERDGLWERIHQAQSAGGLFHYQEQLAAVERQFSRDFRDALALLLAARRGLKDLFDYAPPFPQEGSPAYFDEVAAWATSARQRTASWAQSDQDYVLAVSIKGLAKSAWEAGRSAAEWTFEIPEDLFPGQANVRLRGLALAVVAEQDAPEAAPPKIKPGQKADLPLAGPPKPLGYWSARVSVPPSATVRHPSGTAGVLDQSALPVCYFGRVAERDALRDPEFVPAGALRNAGPIGKGWKLALSRQSTDGAATASLRDVQLYLHVAVRSRKA